MKELKFNIKYLFNRNEFYYALLIVFSVNLIHIFLCIINSMRLNHFIEESYSGEYQFILYNSIVTLHALLIVVFPIVFSMIFSDSNFLENKRKTINMLVVRINLKKNIFIRILSSFILTFLICFFSFLFNYIVLRIIYGTGNTLTFFQGTAFHLDYQTKWFLDSIRINNPVLFVLLINLSVSIMYGLLSVFSYVISFFVRNRIIIYFIPLLFLILTQLLFPLIGFKSLSFITALQPNSVFNIKSYIMCVCFLLVISASLLYIKLFKKDVLV